MEVMLKNSMMRRVWASPRLKTVESREPVALLVCSASTEWNCDTSYPGCGCVRKSSGDQQHDCDTSCGP